MADATCIALRGEFNIFTAIEMKARLMEAVEDADVEVNLADVTEFDSAGLQLMVMAKREAAARGRRLRFTHHSGAVLDLIDLYDLSGFFGDPVVIRNAD